jgi:hypothetical protein
MWQAILAGLLSLQAPGQSIYSQIVVPEGAPAPCADEYSLLCLPPKWSEAHQGYTRAETWSEGLARYVTIAHAIDIVVYQTKRSSPRAHLWRYVAAMIYHESGHWCSRWGGGHVSTCVVGRYAGGMIASRDPRVLARVKTVNKLWHVSDQLEKDVLLELGFLPEVEDPSGPVAIR